MATATRAYPDDDEEASDSADSADSTERSPRPGTSALRKRRHQAAYDAALKEVFISQRVQLTEQISETATETDVYFGFWQGEEVAVKVFTMVGDDLGDVVSGYGAFKVECEKTMILGRRSRHVLQVLEYGDAELPDDLSEDLRPFFPLGLVPFMITERAAYGSLDKAIRNRRRLPGCDRVSLMEAVAKATDGIKEAHEHQVAHRDIKPQNILIFGPREGKIADFGVARWRSRLSRADTVMLTPRYCSPEQAFYALTGRHEGLVGIAGDIYSWAIMVYELVTGKHPYDWAVRASVPKDGRSVQKAVLKAIAANDRRGFVPTGDITFDSLIDRCTCDLKHRITDIAIANRILRELVRRMSNDLEERNR